MVNNHCCRDNLYLKVHLAFSKMVAYKCVLNDVERYYRQLLLATA